MMLEDSLSESVWFFSMIKFVYHTRKRKHLQALLKNVKSFKALGQDL